MTSTRIAKPGHFSLAHQDRWDLSKVPTGCYLSRMLFLGWRRNGSFGPSSLFHEFETTCFPTVGAVSDFISTRLLKGKSWEIKELPLIVILSNDDPLLCFGGFEDEIFDRSLKLPKKRSLGSLWKAMTDSNAKQIHAFRTAFKLPPATMPMQWLKRIPTKPSQWRPTTLPIDASGAIKRVCEINLWLNE